MKEIEINGIWYLIEIDEQEASVIQSRNKPYADDITIPSSFFHEGLIFRVTMIGEAAFRFCKISSIAIPNSLLTVEPRAFEGCWDLAEVHIDSVEAWCNIEFVGPYSNPLVNSWEESWGGNTTNLYIEGEVVAELTIPGTITTIKDSTFSFCQGLTSVIILKGVTSIGNHAFANCRFLISVICEAIEVPVVGTNTFSGVPLSVVVLI